ncbi:siderophore-iron transporter Str3 [Kwoniella heveanensis BCC8398]|uniref:Siderophore-iron transporter Str3 n=1 Tax=Kwoniella heveanensis BCC8398 TaxID=1296120 RepID=A0A1B9GVL6_9TREE|nr:siderophore-iron transporter Str3 [Kwoniella heveanensis BCC8398]
MSGAPQPVREHLNTLAFSENDPIQAEAEAEADKEGSEGNAEHGYGKYNPGAEGQITQDAGVTRIEALYLVFGKGWGIYAFWASIGLIAYVYSLSRSTTAYYAQFATSSFGEHTVIGTIGVINAIVAGVAPPFIAKLADIWSRPHTLTLCVALYAVGYAMCAGAKNIQTVVAGQVIYNVGNTGITFMNSIIIADTTSLQWRAFADAAVNLPYVVNAFVAGYIVEDINAYSQNGWRWGYGMFCILLPVAMSPALAVLLIGDYRAKKLGVSLAKKTEVRTQTLNDSESLKGMTAWQKFRFYWTRLNAFGLLLMGFGFACLLTPMTLNTTAKGGYTNPSLIAMLVIGGILFISWLVWDCFFAEYPFMPRRVLNRTFLACVGVDFFYFFSSYLVNAYFTSWVYVVVDWSDRNYTFFNNIVTVAMCGFAIFFGLLMRYTHRYKYLQLIGLSIRIIGMGLTYHATKSPTDAVLVMSQVCIGFGGAISVISSYIGVQGSVPHQDMAIATAVLNLWSSIGSSISIAISSSVWNKEVPAHLSTYLGDTYNSTELAGIFGSIYVARATEPRALVKQAYMESMNKLFLSALIVSFGSILCGIFASNYYLDQKHNAIEQHKIIKFRNKKEIEEELKEKEKEERSSRD